MTARGPYAAKLSWPPVAGAGTVQVYRDGALVDQFPAGGGDGYVARELWPDAFYSFAVHMISSARATVASFSGGTMTAPARGPFPRLYADDAFVNTPIGSAPSVEASSSRIARAAIAGQASTANLANNNAWGIPIVSADAQSRRYNVGCREYWCDIQFGPVGIPASARPNAGGDAHLVVLEPGGAEMDMWGATHSRSHWSAATRWLESAHGPAANCTTAYGCGGADAAGFALAAGVVRPEEIAQGHIDHALLIATPYTRQGYVACPATSGDGRNANRDALPIGAHVQLDPRVDVASLAIPAWQKVIAVALQRYGAYVGDTGGSLEVRGESNLGRGYNAWARAGVPSDSPSLADLPWSSVRVLSMTRCAS